MKLNFDYCMQCGYYWIFLNSNDCFKFYCYHCGNFNFDTKNYKIEKFCDYSTAHVTKKEWKDIENMNIVKLAECFDHCPYYLEHLVGN